MFIRKPAVAGAFYPSDRKELSETIDRCYTHPLGPGRTPPATRGREDAICIIVPHAAYQYSGPVAAHSYLHASSLPDPDLIVVVAPDHNGLGGGVSTFKAGSWETPLGSMRVDSDATSRLVNDSAAAVFDPESQRYEHSLEVQLPFLQKLYGDSVPLLPVSMTFQDMDTASTVASALEDIVKGRKVVVVASSDLTHYEPASVASKKDHALLEKVVKMDVAGFYSTLEELQVTSCGYGAIAVVMRLAGLLGMERAELLKYATSGDTTGDNLQVVGYASLRFV